MSLLRGTADLAGLRSFGWSGHLVRETGRVLRLERSVVLELSALASSSICLYLSVSDWWGIMWGFV